MPERISNFGDADKTKGIKERIWESSLQKIQRPGWYSILSASSFTSRGFVQQVEVCVGPFQSRCATAYYRTQSTFKSFISL